MEELKEKLLKELCACVVDMEDERVADVAREYVKNNFDGYEGIKDGLAVGMEEAGQLYEEEEYYIPELLICSDAMYAGIDILKSNIKSDSSEEKFKAVVGVVEGDTHDIGKNLFKIMLETAGFEVYDLGRDVPSIEFVNKAKEVGASLIGLSTLITTTMKNMEEVIELLKEESIREDIIVMVGGGAISQSYAKKIGADGYAREASKAAKLGRELVKKLKIPKFEL
ncbi:corrinoid protein [Tepidibacter mesophilus]|uniref:corrinoid protein n=1 Tax=Tepidibacter mesophilus TaxID=655607 RepID=UPI000C07663B|nr:corrinoid protein [Tepidibacter mesophilus]